MGEDDDTPNLARILDHVRTRWNIQLLPLQRRLVIAAPRKGVEPGPSSAKLETTAAWSEDAGVRTR